MIKHGKKFYERQAELLADALNEIVELSLGTELQDAPALKKGWKVWADYYNATREPRRLEDLQRDVEQAKADLIAHYPKQSAEHMKSLLEDEP